MKRVSLPLLLRYPAPVPEHLRHGVVTLGNFDGMHLGHRHVITSLKADGEGLPRTVISFYPHPVKVLRGETQPRLLSSLRVRLRQFGEQGIQLLYGIHFTKAFSKVSARDFIERVLVQALAAKVLVVGEDVGIGYKREGDLEFLKRELPRYGITLRVVPKLVVNGDRPSSQRIRELLRNGDVRGAALLLGAPFSISARVGHGDKRGQKMGFPTANVMTGARLLPKRGVYACRVELDGEWYNGAANIGIRPTFSGTGERLEVHILHKKFESLYGKLLTVTFVDRLRDERKFDSLDDLKAQIHRDIEDAERRLQGAN